MDNIENMTHDDVLDVILDFPLKPRGRKLIITLNMENADGGLVLSENSFAEVQYVISVGDHITDITPGSKILLDLEKMMEYLPSPENSYERIGRIKIRPIEINDKVYGLINDNVVDAIDNREF
jgi:hypothetical protein